MRRKLLLLLLPLLVLPISVAWAQQGTVQGTVTDANTGESIPGVNVRLVETQRGAATNAQGQFSIERVSPGTYTLQATFVGYQTRQREIDVSAGETTTVNLQLQPGAVELEAVAVTALGFEEARDQQGAASSQVSGESISESAEMTISKALSAKASGLNVTSVGGSPGAAARITIRGNRTIQGNNQPLIVVDGVPVFNSTFGSGIAGVQQSNRLNDLNPSDIKSVDVLKGASAAALWGSKAQSGVIVIETKQGSYQSDLNVSFKTSYGTNDLNLLPDLQTRFGQGVGGVYQYDDISSWGDPIADREGGDDIMAMQRGQYFSPFGDIYNGVAVGQSTGNAYGPIPSAGYFDASGNQLDPVHGGKRSKKTYDQGERIFQNGYRLENNLSVSGGGQDGRYYMSVGHTQNDGIIPTNSSFDRTSIRLNADRQFTEKFSVSGSANYIRTNSERAQQGSNTSGILLPAFRTSPTFDHQSDYLVDYYPQGTGTDPGGPVIEDRQRVYMSAIGASKSPTFDNPYFVFNEIENGSLVSRLQGQVEANYSVLDWIELTGRTGIDTYTDRRRVYFPVNSATEGGDGTSTEQQIGEYRINADLIGRATRDLNPNVRLGGTLGMQFTHEEFDNVGGSIKNFSNPVEYRSLSNSEATNSSAFTGQSIQRTVGTFAKIDVDLYDQLFVELTGRVDQSSTFGPETDDSFFYPSANLAWQFHKLIGDNPILSFGKLRASAGIVGREPGPYNAFTYFSPHSTFDGYIGQTLAGSGYGGGFQQNAGLGNPEIQPEQTSEVEVGTDLRFFEDRVSLTANAYFARSEDVIFFASTAPSSGFAAQLQNAATLEDKGIELDLEVQWPSIGDFQWTTGARWSANENIVTDLQGTDEIGLAGFVGTTSSLVEGEEFGVLYGDTFREAPEGCQETTPTQICEPLTGVEQSTGFSVGNDDRVLDQNGFPMLAGAQGVVGNPNPDWRAGIDNTLSWKGLSLYTLFDFKVGGDVWNGTKGALYDYGTHGDTDWQTTFDPSEYSQTPVNYQGLTPSQLISNGLWPDYRENDDGTYTFRGQIKDFGAGPVLLDEYYYDGGPGGGFTGPTDQFIEDGSFVKLREVSLSYNWTGNVIDQVGLSSVRISATGSNLVTWTDYSGIDPETNLTGPSNGQGLDYFNNPNMRSYQFSIELNY